ncbi:hypothetical protein N7533_001605 [Penicillium manginii]|uniref:uncharacterized protein n=1 Tax=Penicillium manginii TaxID=203109 RepID=UPI0025485B82|nr:uncharacterized protein N7533_001605 [Penicillium manginii]KAJ5762924.1 hypothetical protein N7533_001605 [Penicillium manginii]
MFEETLTSQYNQEILDEQQQTLEVQSADSNSLRFTIGAEKNTFTVTNNSSGGECGLQYVTYVQFLANVEQEKPALLETTARTFTTVILSCRPASKPFRIPGFSFSSLISAPANGFDVGASHEFEAGLVMRVPPMLDRDIFI